MVLNGSKNWVQLNKTPSPHCWLQGCNCQVSLFSHVSGPGCNNSTYGCWIDLNEIPDFTLFIQRGRLNDFHHILKVIVNDLFSKSSEKS